MEEAATASNTYTIRPNFKHKWVCKLYAWKLLHGVLLRFRPAAVKDLIHKVLLDYLSEKKYSSEDTPTWTKEIGDTIISQLKSVDVVYS